MKVGLYGGLANNCYVFANSMHLAGIEVIFIRDRNDRYALSQPVWEDASFVLDYGAVLRSSSLSWKDWAKIERDKSWQPPSWLFDPLEHQNRSDITRLIPAWLRPLASKYIKEGVFRPGVLFAMQNCDVLLVCGIEATILAMFSGRPYIIWPHGGDIRFAAGLANAPPGFNAKINFYFQKILLNEGYSRAIFVGAHDPKCFGGFLGNVNKVLKKTEFIHLPLPLSTINRSGNGERKRRLNELLKSFGLNIPQTDFIGIVPSRIDFFWKGQDLLLKALGKMKSSKYKLGFIFSGWGNDYLNAKKLAKELGVDNQVSFLPFSLSKPLLKEFLLSVDFAVDQFFFGSYGTALVEALSAGCPTIMWIDDCPFINCNWDPPPVINAKTENDICNVLNQICSGEINLEKISQQSQDWVRRVHSPDVVLPKLMSRFEKLI